MFPLKNQGCFNKTRALSMDCRKKVDFSDPREECLLQFLFNKNHAGVNFTHTYLHQTMQQKNNSMKSNHYIFLYKNEKKHK